MKRPESSHSANIVLAIVAGAVLLAAAQVGADDTQELIESIVRGAKDDVDAAAKLIIAAKSLEDAPKAQIAICERAYDCGAKSAAGYASAIEALDMLESLDRGRLAVWRQERLKVYRLRYARSGGKDRHVHGEALVKLLLEVADGHAKGGKLQEAVNLYRQALPVAKLLKLGSRGEISEKLHVAGAQLRVRKLVARLKARLASDPGDKRARDSLVRLLVADLDSPAEAAKYLNADCDEELRTCVPLAAGPVEKLTDAQCLDLGRWYKDLSARVTVKAGKIRILERARKYLLRYLELHPKKDVARVKGVLALAEVKKLLEELQGAGALPLGAIQVLTFDKAHWSKKDGSVQIKDARGRGRDATGSRISLAEGIAGQGARIGPGGFIDTRIAHSASPKTLAFWAKADKVGQRWVVICGLNDRGGKNRFYVGFDAKGNLGLGLGDSLWANESKGYQLDTDWHHYALTWDGKTMRAYVDGGLKATKVGKAAPKGTYYIGAYNLSGRAMYGLRGLIDEAAIFSRVLSQREIQRLMDRAKKGKSTTKPVVSGPSRRYNN